MGLDSVQIRDLIPCKKAEINFQKLFLHNQHSVVKGSKTSELTARDVSDYALSASGTPLM